MYRAYLLTDRPSHQFLRSKRKDDNYLSHYPPQYLGQFGCERDTSIDLETL